MGRLLTAEEFECLTPEEKLAYLSEATKAVRVSVEAPDLPKDTLATPPE